MKVRSRAAAVATVAALAVSPFAAPAWADSATAQGTSDSGKPTDVDKLVVNNRADSVLAKVYGTGGRTAARWTNLNLKDRDGTQYKVMGGWYGADWIVSLERGQTLVDCPTMTHRYVASRGFWKIVVPRSCLKRLADRIKAKAETVTPTSAYPGYTSWTSWIGRG